MATQAAAPSMSDAAVKAKTGRDWAEWFALLDRAKAQGLPHREIVSLVGDRFGAPRWWRQMITVEYERARGLRVRHETAGGFSVSISKTLAADLARLYGATADAEKRKIWFPEGAFAPTSATPNKYFRGAWKGMARLEINFYAKGADKAQITVQVNKLADAAQVEHERAAWKSALELLISALERPALDKAPAAVPAKRGNAERADRCSSTSPPGRKSRPISPSRKRS